MAQQGQISINSENMMPIIKKWLYSDKDIFIRELIANGTDAITKHKKLVDMGEADADDAPYEVRVAIDADAGTLTFCDNGIGMSAEEVKNYIAQVAFSGAEDFIKQYEQAEGSIIGHFGLGFYSAFMVASKVEIVTKSYRPGDAAVRWVSEDGAQYEIDEADKQGRGTRITLHLNDDDKEFLDYYTTREIIEKYCGFLPVPIYLDDPREQKRIEEMAQKAAKEGEEPVIPEQEPLNDTQPLWLKAPKDCTDDEYKTFYRKVFRTFEDPLFWIHLNVDYPFNLKGILYFPQLKKQFDRLEGEIKIYNNQMFVADNIKEIIPEFLLLLKGCIDCPDLPLNVSRSFLQNDGTVRKLQAHITKKVADRLTGMFKNERETYENYWPDIAPFVRFGCIRDEKFYDQVKDALLFERIGGGIWSLEEATNYAKEHEGKLFYTDDEKAQAYYIDMFRTNGDEAVKLDGPVDSYFLMFLEQKAGDVKLVRIDSEIAASAKGDGQELDAQEQQALFRDISGDAALSVEYAPLKDETLPAMLLSDEDSRRMAEMMKNYGMTGQPVTYKLILNANNPLARDIGKLEGEQASVIAQQVYDIARLGAGVMSVEDMRAFIARSNKVLEMLTQKSE